MARESMIVRKTKETDIELKLTLKEHGVPGSFVGSSGIGFLDHMMSATCVHGGMDITLKMEGDLEVDAHHSTEDLGIVFGKALAEAVGNKNGLMRYGTSFVPMDEALSRTVLDISERPFLVFNAEFKSDKIGDLDTQLIKEFFRAVAFNAGITLHIEVLYGENDHHKAEAIFKSFARAFADGARENKGGCLSSKGTL
jgi:imidazoleglycerol-phosphate dehydratase